MSPRLVVILAALFLWAACDLDRTGAGSGCVRVHQGDYAFPAKRVVKRSLAVRTTQAGVDVLTSRLRALVLTFFEADANGHAVIPLDDLGVGTLSLSAGPLQAELRDLVLTLDLSSLQVALAPQASPARLRVTVQDAVLGIQSAVVAGTMDSSLVQGDLACRLANGPSGRVARVSFAMDVDLDTDAAGALEVSVADPAVTFHELPAATVVTDCELPECTDGCPDCADSCEECAAICDVTQQANELAAELAAPLEDVLVELLGGLATWLTDVLDQVLVDGLLNGRPLAVEGTLDVGGLAAPLLPSLATAGEVGVLGRPAGEAFEVTGIGAARGLEVDLDAGVHAAAVHPCAGDVGSDPTWVPGAVPDWPQAASGPGGAERPYHLGVGVSDALVNEALWASWKAGALCVDLTTADVAGFTAGELRLTAGALELMLPGIASLAGADAPVRVRLRPRLGGGRAVRFDDPGTGAPVAMDLEAEIGLAVLIDGHFLRVLSFQGTMRLGLAVDALGGGRLGVRLGHLALDDVQVEAGSIFAEARIDRVAPFVVDLVLGVVADRPLSLDLDLLALADLLPGVPLVPVVVGVDPAGDWLRVLVALEEAPARAQALAADRAHLVGLRPGLATIDVDASPDLDVQFRVAGGGWGRWRPAPGRHEVAHPRLWLRGPTWVEARLRPVDGLPGPATRIAEGAVVESSPVAAAHAPAAAPPDAADASGGCAAGGRGGTGWLVLAALLLPVLWRRRFRLLPLLAALLAAGCADEAAPERACAHHDQCPDEYLCGPDGTCILATPCEDDLGCCPGARCFEGWCRPTLECDPERPCQGLGEVCEASACVAAPCGGDGACPGERRCVAGRCVEGVPCGGSCPPGRSCHLATDRCLSTPACVTSCAPGTLRAVEAGAPVDPLRCGGLAVGCTCAELPPLAPPQPGYEGTLAEVGGDPVLLSYDPVYGDLVASRWGGGERRDLPVDGVPDATIAGPVEGYRGGVVDAGPDRGRRPAAVVGAGEGGTVLDVLHRDGDVAGVRHTRLDGVSDATLRSVPIPLDGDAGEWSCLARDPGTGRLQGWVYVRRDASGERTRLLRLTATAEPPVAASDWLVEVMVDRPRPPTAEAPCDGVCGLLEACVRAAPGHDRCARLIGAECPQGCGAHAVCGDLDGVATCLPRVLPEDGGADLPPGAGLFVSCAAAPDGVVAAWYDADAGALVVARGAAGPGIVDGTPAPGDVPDVGRHADVAVGPGGAVAVAAQDASHEALRVALQEAPGAPWVVETVHGGAGADGALDLGAWPDVAWDATGAPVVAYVDATGGDVWVARREGGCWRRVRAIAGDGWAWPSLVARPDGRLWLSAMSFRFDEALIPRHQVALHDIPAPAGPCPDR